MADYDFGDLASPTKTDKKQNYDFGDLATAKITPQVTKPIHSWDLIPGQPGLKPPTAPAKTEEEPGILDTLKGAGETALSLGTGALAGPIGAARGLYEGVTGGKLGTQAGVEQAKKKGGELAEKLTYTPKTETGKKFTGALGDFFKDSGIEAFGGLGGEASAIGEAAKAAKPALAARAGQAAQAARPALAAGASKVAQAVKESPEAYMLGNVAKGVQKTAGAAGQGVRNVASKAMGFDPDAVKLAQKAKSYGINIRPDMLSDKKVVKMMGEALEHVPLSGSKAEARQEAFNVALIKEIGGDPKAKRLNSEVFADALNKSGKEIGRIGEKYGVKIDQDVQDSLKSFANDAKKYETKDVKKIVNNYINEIKSKSKYEERSKNAELDGKAFRKLNSKMSRQAASTSNGDLKNALGDLQDIMHNALEKSIPPKELKAWNTARMHYAKAKTIEPLVAKSTYGDISGPSLLARVTADKAGKSRMARGAAGGLGDLAKIGQLIKEPPSSGTAERNLAYGLLGGGAYANPLATAGVYGAANLYNRLGQYLIPPPPKP